MASIHSTAAPTVVIDHLTFSFSDGTPVFDDLSLNIPAGFTAIMGPNGLGKSVLLKLISGDLAPSSGHVSLPSPAAVLPQDLLLRGEDTIANLMGISEVLSAIDELSQTDPEPTPERVAQLLEVIGDDWDIADTSLAFLAEYGPTSLHPLGPDVLQRHLDTLSGGEAMLVALTGLRRMHPQITLLDEPTNNLDEQARHTLISSLRSWPGSVVVVSHDRTLLRAAENIVELKPARVRRGRPDGVVPETFGGWDARQRVVSDREEAAGRRLNRAMDQVRQEKRTRESEQTRASRSAAQGRKAAENAPKLLTHTMKRKAEANTADTRATREARVESAMQELDAAREALKQLVSIDVDLPGTRLGAGTRVLAAAMPLLPTGGILHDDGTPVIVGAPLSIRGPERIILSGPNGSGKTTLLEAILPSAAVPVGVLSQRRGTTAGEELDASLSSLDNLLRRVPDLNAGHARDVLARLALRGERVHLPLHSLSGGERFRVDLARVLAASPAPQLLVLDEPTNDLDLDSVQALAAALSNYGGALLVVSHDRDFLADVGVTRQWRLEEPDA